MKKVELFFLIVILCLNFSFGQEKWTHFTKNDGLASTWIRDCLEDKQGNIWFATDKGVSKFDGVKLETFTEKDGLPGGFAQNIYEDKNGNIWILTGKNVFNPLALIVNFVPIQYYREVGVSIIYADNNINYLNNYKTDDYHFGAICEDVDGNVWIGGYIEKIEKSFIMKNFDGKSWDSLPEFGRFDYAPFYNFFIDDGLNIWTFSLDDDFITRTEGTNRKSYGKHNGLPTKQRNKLVQIILEDSNDNLWFGASSEEQYGSLMKFDGTNWTTYTEDDGVIGKSINGIVEDNDGNIWVATNKGISVFNGSSWVHYSEKDQLPSNKINTIIADSKDRVWIGTAKGLTLFDNGKWSQFKSQTGLAHNNVRVLKEDSRGNIWVGAASAAKKGGVSVYIDNKWMSFTSDKLPDFYTYDIFEDSKGNMWILSIGNGVFKYEYQR